MTFPDRSVAIGRKANGRPVGGIRWNNSTGKAASCPVGGTFTVICGTGKPVGRGPVVNGWSGPEVRKPAPPRDKEVGAALRTGHRVGGARRWRATLVESNADGVTGCARTCTKQGYQRMRRPIYRRTAAACDPGIEHVLHGNRRVDGVD